MGPEFADGGLSTIARHHIRAGGERGHRVAIIRMRPSLGPLNPAKIPLQPADPGSVPLKRPDRGGNRDEMVELSYGKNIRFQKYLEY